MTLKDKKQLLKEYRAAETLILELGDRRCRWSQLAERSVASKNDVEGFLADFDRRIAALSQMKRSIESAVEAIDDSTLRHLIKLRYILGADWDSVAEGIGYSRRQTFNLHNIALEKLQFAKDCTNCTF